MTPTPYDEVDYGGNAQARTAPNRMAGTARLLGLRPASPARARVLELGCGNGANLVPLAWYWPQASFVGVDLATTAIEAGRRDAAALGLRNLELHPADVAALRAADLGQFDFVIAHGLLSWVPEPVRLATMRLLGEVLAPGGVGYVSYNAYPGCRVRHLSRELMLFHLRDRPYGPALIEPAWSLMQSVQALSEQGAPAFLSLLRVEAKEATSISPSFMFHDDLSQYNQPLYLHEFAAVARANGLAYLGDAAPETMFEPTTAPELTRWLDEVSAGDWLARQQYLDFVSGCRFKRSLVCRAADAPRRGIDANALASLHWRSDYSPRAAVRADDDSEARFTAPNRPPIETNHPLIKTALMLIHGSRRMGIDVAELAARVAEGSADAQTHLQSTGAFMTRLMQAGIVHPVLEAAEVPAPVVLDGPTPPALGPLARLHLQAGHPLVDRSHTQFRLSEPWMDRVAARLDGTATLDALADELDRSRGDPEAGELPTPGETRTALLELLRILDRRGLLDAPAGQTP
jgi:SAM-dependent methyltransferase